MSLTLYLYEKDIPNNVELCKNNDLFFDGCTLLKDTDLYSNVLMNIDQAVYNTPETFIGRDSSLGAIYRENLSTGCKTLLNIINNPNICFSLIECGVNAKELALQLPHGQALWYVDQLDIDNNASCDVICNGRHFTKIGDLIDYIDDEV